MPIDLFLVFLINMSFRCYVFLCILLSNVAFFMKKIVSLQDNKITKIPIMNLKVRLAVMNFLEFAVWGAYLTSMGG